MTQVGRWIVGFNKAKDGIEAKCTMCSRITNSEDDMKYCARGCHNKDDHKVKERKIIEQGGLF